MPRSRNIKPSFFTNEELVELPHETRLLFIGLWTLADRCGRLEDRPKRIKMNIFPAENIDADACLDSLERSGFILRYEVDNQRFIQVLNFEKHQNPHKNEKESTIPPPEVGKTSTLQEPTEHGASTVQEHEGNSDTHADSFNLIPDSCNKHTDHPAGDRKVRTANRFEEFWSIYPRKKGRKKAEDAWRRKRLDEIADTIIADVHERQKRDTQWIRGYIPHGSTYVNSEGWKDAIDESPPGNGSPPNREWGDHTMRDFDQED